MTDEKLFSLCKMFGAQALEARRKFLGLLPEVNRREQAAKKIGRSWLMRRGFTSIFEFAKKLAGVSEEQVRIVLNLERRFVDKPVLQAMLITGEVSVNKLARVVSIATKENQEALAEQVKLLPKSALGTLVKDIKYATVNGFGEPNLGLPGQTSGNEKADAPYGQREFSNDNSPTPGELLTMKMDLKLDNDIITELNELQEKGININEILRVALNKRRDQIAQEKERLANKENAKNQLVVMETAKHSAPDDSNTSLANPLKKPLSRYISVRVKKVLAEEHGAKCSIPNCQNTSEQIHHTRRFALTGNHDPHFLAPLCREHHLIAHSVDEKFWLTRMM